jgi:uncharacterized protein YfaS (alpha-2-macroglobulin family)
MASSVRSPIARPVAVTDRVTSRSRHAWRLAVVVVILAGGLSRTAALAQESSPTPPAFSLATAQVFTPGQAAYAMLTFRQVDHLDFRVYRIEDVAGFFTTLRDPHVLGSPEPLVAQEPTAIERIVSWKARQRERLRAFFRRQFSTAFRRARSAARDRARVAERRSVRDSATFAQVPLLNPDRLVASWRELLPRTREAEVRRIPLDLPAPGLYLVEAVHDRVRAYTIAGVTSVGILTKTSPGELMAWVVDRDSGEPRDGCTITALANRAPLATATTAGDGVGRIGLPATDTDALVTLARCGAEIAIVDPGGFFAREAAAELVGYVYTDRPVYRPGDTAHVKAILRWRERGRLRPFDGEQAEVSVSDTAGKVVFRDVRPVDAFGAVVATVALPAAAALGPHIVRVASGDAAATGSFEVQEYRKPEFEVAVSPGARFVIQGQQARFTIDARYYFGQPVANARVEFVVHRGYYYSPWRWVDQPDGDVDALPGFFGGDQIATERTTLDATGSATLLFPVPQDEERRDLTLRVEARVRDASGREVAGHAVIVAPWARLLLALATDRYVYQAGARAAVRVRALDYQGMPHADVPVRLVLERLQYRNGRYDRPAAETVTRGDVTTGTDGRAEWAFSAPATAGDYRVRVESTVDGRPVTAETALHVPGAEETFYDEGDRFLELVADRATYQPGDTARLVLRGEAVTAPVLVTKEREQTAWHEVVRPGSTNVVDVPIDEDDLGDVWVNVAFVRDDRVYRAERRLRVPPVPQTLQVSVEPAQAVTRPRDPGFFTVRVTDASGMPVRAQVSLSVVDEALYAVQPDVTPDPVRFFHRRGYSRVGTQFSRDYSFVGYSGDQVLTLAQRKRPLALADFKADRPERPEVRREFPDAILWIADVVTDDRGEARVAVTYPDALTTWRATARAVTVDTRAGAGVAHATVTKDVILRLATPRFLTEGDRLQLPVIVHNYREESAPFEVAVEAQGLSVADAPAGPPGFDIPPGGQRGMLWGLEATRAGRATVAGHATTPGDGDRVEQSFPVLPYGLRRETGASGSSIAATDVKVRLDVPARSNPAARTIEVALAPTLGGSLLGAVDFLTSYPYGCTEQILSSFLPNLLVTRTLDALEVAPPERLAAVDRMTAQGLRRLLDMQHEDGGWGWWAADQNHPFMTAYALYGLLEAERAGSSIDRWRLSQAATATARLYAEYPRAVPELKAYLTRVLTRASARGVAPSVGNDVWDQARALEELWQARERLDAYGRALLLLALADAEDARQGSLAADLLAAAVVQGDLAWWPSARDPLLGDDVDTTVEATALAIQALAPRQPDHPTLERAVRWLLANRAHGAYWASTKQTALALYGLLALMEARGDQPATFAVDVLVNGEPAGSHTFTPESWTAAGSVVVSAPARPGTNDVVLVKRGAGSLYWTATARYYETGEQMAHEGSRRLALTREYFSLAAVQVDGRTVYRTQALAPALTPGDLVLVRLTAAGAADWRYLVLEDPLPAGMEPVLEPELYELERPVSWWTGSQREYRDARVVQFQESFERGRYEYHYLLKAVTPGTFRAMPAQIAPMYVPGTAASTAAQTVGVAADRPLAPNQRP